MQVKWAFRVRESTPMADKEASTNVAAYASRSLAGLKLSFKDVFAVGGRILQTSSFQGLGRSPSLKTIGNVPKLGIGSMMNASR